MKKSLAFFLILLTHIDVNIHVCTHSYLVIFLRFTASFCSLLLNIFRLFLLYSLQLIIFAISRIKQFIMSELFSNNSTKHHSEFHQDNPYLLVNDKLQFISSICHNNIIEMLGDSRRYWNWYDKIFQVINYTKDLDIVIGTGVIQIKSCVGDID